MTRLGDFIFEANSNPEPISAKYTGRQNIVAHNIPNRRFPIVQSLGGGGRSIIIEGIWTGSRDTMVKDIIALKELNEIVPFTKDDDGDLDYTEGDAASWATSVSASTYDDASVYKVGANSMKASDIPTTEEVYYNADMALDLTDAGRRCLAYYVRTDVAEDPVIRLYTGSKGANYFYTADGVHTGSDTADTWDNIVIPVGQQAEDDGVWLTAGSPDWTDLYSISFNWTNQSTTVAYIDGLTFTTGVLITGFNHDDMPGKPTIYRWTLRLEESYQE